MLGDCLRGLADDTPDAPAIVSRGRAPLTYAGLFDQVARTVHVLNRAGYGRGDRIALALPSGPETTVALLGTLAGCVCMPFNPASSVSELRVLLSRCRADALVTMPDFFARAVEAAVQTGIPIIALLPAGDGATGRFRFKLDTRARRPQTGFSTEHEVGAIFATSGTTALPKLIPITQADIRCHAQRAMQYLGLTSADRCLDLLPPFHYEPMNASILPTLFAGGSSVYPNAMSPRHFIAWLREFRPTWCAAPPPFFQSLLPEIQRERGCTADLGIRTLFTCGAPVDEHTAAALEQMFQAPLRNSYGATECGGISINPVPPGIAKRGSLGPSVGLELRIVDESGEPVGVGQIGEIVVRGAGVFRGYEGDPEGNSNTFFGEWYRTQDQGYLDDDGYVFLTGRIREMINRGGQKIAPLEVDEVLRSHPDVAEAVAFAIPDPLLGEDVAAAVVLKRPDLGVDELRRFAWERLTPSKVPKTLLIVREIPKGPAGKVQRNRLAVLFADELARTAPGHDTPRTAESPVQATERTRTALPRSR